MPMTPINQNFIPPELAGFPLDMAWQGFDMHIGPVDRSTPLLERLAGKTLCGTLALSAGVTLWAARRIETACDVSVLRHLAEVMFAYQFDWRYFEPGAYQFDKEPDHPVEASLLKGVAKLIARSLNHDYYWEDFYSPSTELFHMAHATGWVIPKQILPVYEAWLYQVSDYLDQVAAKPDDPDYTIDDFPSEREYYSRAALHRGTPIPPEVLSSQSVQSAEELEVLARQFLAKLDPETNPFLCPVKEMRKKGFQGEPYAR